MKNISSCPNCDSKSHSVLYHPWVRCTECGTKYEIIEEYDPYFSDRIHDVRTKRQFERFEKD